MSEFIELTQKVVFGLGWLNFHYIDLELYR